MGRHYICLTAAGESGRMRGIMRKKRVIQPGKYCHLVSRVAHRAYFVDDEEKSRFVDLLSRVEFFCCVRVLAYLRPLMTRGYIAQTLPKKPKSPLQRDRLSRKGRSEVA